MKSKPDQKKNFQTDKQVLFYDRLMARIIRLGGLGIILAVLGIFVFIVTQVGPLFIGARIEPSDSFTLKPKDYRFLGLDEWGERPFLVTRSGELEILDVKNPQRSPESIQPFDRTSSLKVLQYDPAGQNLLYVSEEGNFAFATLQFQPQFEQKTRRIQYQIKTSPFFPLNDGAPILEADFNLGENSALVAGITEEQGRHRIKGVRLKKEESLLSEGEWTPGENFDLTDFIHGTPQFLRINESGDILLVATQEGDIFYFRNDGEIIKFKQKFHPFGGNSNPQISSMDFLLGGVSVYLTNPQGKNLIYGLFIPEGQSEHQFGKIHEFSDLPGPAHGFSKSLRNKAFLIASQGMASLRHGTTESIRWEEKFSKPIRLTALSKKFQKLALFDKNNLLQIFNLNDPHPEASFKSFFGKVWYEGRPKPEYIWQSTGGTDAFEPKLSLIPLIVGTLKGTCYALLFAIPIALLAAVYTSQFLHPNLKKVIKPVMEIMASLPSVILGFLAALWLAPRIENAVPSLILLILSIPFAAILFGLIWNHLPKFLRVLFPEGREWLAFLPVLLLISWGAWKLGQPLENWLFVTHDPISGERIADFRLWWNSVTGGHFEQRNSLVVGIIMGFAVIPLIFTLAEDSLSAVPTNLRSASLALGASRWQTAFRVILPAALAGILSAIMIGFGRAVGETMIVLMATGNTPLMDFDIFTGMRTLSANLAVELPEAPLHSTLYRTLFLGALILFLMTFSVNSFAELMRQRIRKKFKGL